MRNKKGTTIKEFFIFLSVFKLFNRMPCNTVKQNLIFLCIITYLAFTIHPPYSTMSEIGGDVNLVIFLIGILSESDSALINKLFEEHNIKLYNIALRILKTDSDAQEAVQETFLKIIAHIDKISKLPDSEITPYCVVILKSSAITMIRRQSKTVYWEDVECLEPSSENIENDVIKNFEKEMLLKTVEHLSEEDRYIVQLHWALGKSYKEIANLLGISEETTKKRSQRILLKMKKALMEGDHNKQFV